MANYTVEFKNGMKIGLGYNRLSGDVSPSPAVQGSSISSLQHAGGQQVTTDCATIQDVAVLHKSLGISVEGGAAYMGASASAKVDYVRSCDFSSFSTYVVVRVSVQNAVESIDSPVFHADANELLVNDNPERFRQRFGDTFIAGVMTGGEYFAIYQITGSSQSEKESVAVKVRAAYDNPLLPVSAHLNTDIQTAMSASSSHLEISCHVFRQGTISTADLTIEDVMKTAREFPVGVSGDKAFPYALLLQDYNGLKSPNDKFNFIEIQNRQDVLQDLAKKRFEFLALRDDIAYVLKYSGDFRNADGSPVNRDALKKDFDEVVNAINTMQAEATLCARDAGKCSFTSFDTAKFRVPVLANERQDPLIAAGEARVKNDPLAIELRNTLPDAPSRRGFNYAYGLDGEATQAGPGKDRARNTLPDDEKSGFDAAVSYFLMRNQHIDEAVKGAAVAQADAEVAAARGANAASVFFKLGFDIATSLFGDPALGALGSTLTGPGSDRVRGTLNTAAQKGFDAALKFHLGPPLRRRK